MNNALSLEAEIACLNVQEMAQLAQSVCDQLHRLEALVGRTISVPNQVPHSDEAGSRYIFFGGLDFCRKLRPQLVRPYPSASPSS